MQTTLRRFLGNERNVFFVFLSSLTYLLFFRPAEGLRLISVVDEHCYIVWLYRFIGVETSACYSDAHTFGTAVMWIPFGLLGRAVGFVTSTQQEPWIQAFVGLSAFLFWAISLFLIADILGPHKDRGHNEKRAKRDFKTWIIPFIVLLNVPLLFYATRRTMMSHPPEFLLAVTSIWALQRGKIALSLASYVLLVCTRINHLPMICVMAGAFLDAQVAKSSIQLRVPKYAWYAAGAIAIALAIPILRIAFITGYDSVSIPDMLASFDGSRLYERFLGPPFALVLTATTFLMVFGWGMARIADLSWTARGTMVWLATQFFICVFWPTNGGTFGYRYLIGAYAGAILVYTELVKLEHSAAWSLTLRRVAVINAGWLVFLAWIFNSRLWPWRTGNEIPTGLFAPLAPLKALTEPIVLAGFTIYTSIGTLVVSLLPELEPLHTLANLDRYRFSPAEAWVLFVWTLFVVGIFLYSSKLVGVWKIGHKRSHD